MAKNTASLESSAKIVTETAEQVTARTREAIENYFNWLQKTMSEVPWGSTELNKKLLGYATESLQLRLRRHSVCLHNRRVRSSLV